MPGGLGSGTTQYGRWYRLVLGGLGGGTASTPKSGDETLLGSNFESIGAYKNPTLFCMKGYESIEIILSNWGVKVLKTKC